MTLEQLAKLKEWVAAFIDCKLAVTSSDSGLIEAVRLSEVNKELDELFKNDRQS